MVYGCSSTSQADASSSFLSFNHHPIKCVLSLFGFLFASRLRRLCVSVSVCDFVRATARECSPVGSTSRNLFKLNFECDALFVCSFNFWNESRKWIFVSARRVHQPKKLKKKKNKNEREKVQVISRMFDAANEFAFCWMVPSEAKNHQMQLGQAVELEKRKMMLCAVDAAARAVKLVNKFLRVRDGKKFCLCVWIKIKFIS